MVFLHKGIRYDTAQMRQFRTGDPDLPLICVTADRAEVFLFSPAYRGGLRATKATSRAVRLAAVGYRFPGLLQESALAGSPNP
ncbi:MAG TPA: hypothetical protein VGI81_10815 [Tepidisphaeraceae bacterium]|jgi:hypothetical protein